MHSKMKVNLSLISAEFFSALCVTACVLPGFKRLGDILAQVTASALATLVFLLIADKLLKISPKIIAHSLWFMTVFWTSFALVKQINLHLQAGDYTFNWLHLFYYDRPAMLFVVFFVAIIYYVIKLIFKSNDGEFVKNYSKFIKNTTVCLLIFYFIILIYCFILTRRFSPVRPQINFVPFDTIITTFSLGYVDYELLFLFLGNIAIFFPLGIFIPALIKNKFILAITPLIVSVSIEASQYFLGNGAPDIDDVILNVLGFYLGVILKMLLDKLLFKYSKGKLKSFFIF